METPANAKILRAAARLQRAGCLPQARGLYCSVLQRDADQPDALHSLAAIAYQAGCYDEALDWIARAIASNPNVPLFHNTNGLILEAVDQFDKAVNAYSNVLRLKPDHAEAYNNMAIALQAQGNYNDAVRCCEEAVLLQPDYAQAYNTMGFAFEKQGKCADAFESYQKAVSFKPDYAEAHNHLGVLAHADGRHEEALQHWRHAVEIEPDYAEAHWNLALALLLTGRLDEGWRQYQWRHNPQLNMLTYPHQLSTTRWDGGLFQDKRLLVYYEQGFGDTLQFVRYLPMVKKRGGTVILEIRKPLVALLRRLPGVDELVEASPDAAPAVEVDLHISLMDLPAVFATTIETIVADVPYIYADPARTAHCADAISGPGFKVGIVWSGSTDYERNDVRCCRLEHFAPLAAIEGVQLYSLQKGPPAAQVQELAAKLPITNIAEHFHDFADTAAAIENMDLVVSADTSVLHLAAAMGKPVWALICSAPAWQWMLDRTDSPWYPTMRIFRQTKPGCWNDVFQNVARQLRMLVTDHGPRSR
jgi:tetratricopeptide (TPR) repeat protein